jgi:hypothetical protein
MYVLYFTHCYEDINTNSHTAGSVLENLQTVRTDCTCLIAEGLCKSYDKMSLTTNPNAPTGAILNIKNVSMSYMKYDCDIVSKYKVELLGWPTSIKFANPSEIGVGMCREGCGRKARDVS